MRVPSIRARFVARAQYLQDDKLFLAAIEAAARGWNLDFPRFAIGVHEIPPDEPVRNGLRDIYPPGIVQPLGTDGDRDVREDASERWNGIVYEHCIRWWPTRYYPNWVDRFAHPARNFMSGCLIWNPKHVPTEWIDRVALAPREAPAYFDDPAAMQQHPDVVYWKSLYWEVMQRIDATIKADPSLTVSQLEEISRAADDAAIAAMRESGSNQPFSRYLLLFPGMTSTDLRENEREIIEFANAGGGLPHDIRTLRSEGLSHEKIARLLGISRTYVGSVLKEKQT